MPQSIAKASVLLDANGVDLDNKLNASANKLKEWGKKTEQATGQDKGKDAGSALAGLAKYAVPAAIFAGVMKAGQGFLALVDEVGTKMRGLVQSAMDVGSSLQGFAALSSAAKVAGVSTDTLKAGLMRFQSVLHSSDAARIFDQLGLSAANLQKMSRDDALGAIATSLLNVKDSGLQAKLGIEIFGDAYSQMIPLLNKGKDGIKSLTDLAKSSGAAPDIIDAKKVNEAQESISRLGLIWEGVKNKFVTLGAPALDFAIKSFTYGFAAIADVGGLILSVLTTAIVKPLQWSINLAAKLQATLGNAAGAKTLKGYSDQIDNFTTDLTLATTGWIDKAHQYFNKFDEAARKSGQNAKTALAPVDAALAELLKGISSLEKELRDSFTRIGKTGAEIKIMDFEKNDRATPAMLAQVKELAEQAKNAEIAFSNIQMPPMETFERSVKGLNVLFSKGRLTIEQYQKGIVQASKSFGDAVGVGQTKTTAGQLAGSRDAVSSVVKAELQDQRQDPQAELKRAFAEAQQIRMAQLQAANKLIEVVQGKKDLGVNVI